MCINAFGIPQKNLRTSVATLTGSKPLSPVPSEDGELKIHPAAGVLQLIGSAHSVARFSTFENHLESYQTTQANFSEFHLVLNVKMVVWNIFRSPSTQV